MKRKIVCSVAALLAGTGFAAAQELELASARMSQGTSAQMGHLNICNSCDTPAINYCNDGCGYNFRFYGSLDYLLWKMGESWSTSGGSFIPSIRSPMPYGVATVNSDQFGIAFFSPLLASNSLINDFDFSGARLTLGANLNREWGAELSYFQLERREAGFVGAASTKMFGFSDGIDTFNPFVNVAVQGLGSRKLFGFEGNVKHHAATIGQLKLSELVGVRYLDLEQNQQLNQALQFVPDFSDVNGGAGILIGDNISTYNGTYRATNQFVGVTVGLRADVDFGTFYTSLTGKLSVGGNRQTRYSLEEVNTTSTMGNIPGTIFPGPVESEEDRTRLAYVLEGTWNAGFHITDNLSVYAGYNILILNRSAKPVDNASPTGGTGAVSLANPTLIAPLLNLFEETRFVAHGLNVGLELRY